MTCSWKKSSCLKEMCNIGPMLLVLNSVLTGISQVICAKFSTKTVRDTSQVICAKFSANRHSTVGHKPGYLCWIQYCQAQARLFVLNSVLSGTSQAICVQFSTNRHESGYLCWIQHCWAHARLFMSKGVIGDQYGHAVTKLNQHIVCKG